MPAECYIGDLFQLNFYFSNTALTTAQTQAFEAGSGLPNGYGVTPTAVYLDYQQPGFAQITTVTSPSIVQVATGVYYYLLDTTPSQGRWAWRAYSTGTYQASFEDYLDVYATLPGPGA